MPGPVEGRLGQHRAAEQQRHLQAHDRHDRHERVPERVAVDDVALGDRRAPAPPRRSRRRSVWTTLTRTSRMKTPPITQAERHRRQDQVLARRPRTPPSRRLDRVDEQDVRVLGSVACTIGVACSEVGQPVEVRREQRAARASRGRTAARRRRGSRRCRPTTSIGTCRGSGRRSARAATPTSSATNIAATVSVERRAAVLDDDRRRSAAPSVIVVPKSNWTTSHR